MTITKENITKELEIYKNIFDDTKFNTIIDSIHNQCVSDNSVENTRGYMENMLRVLLIGKSNNSSAINKTTNNPTIVNLLKGGFRKLVTQVSPNANNHYIEAQSTGFTNRFIEGETFCSLAEEINNQKETNQTQTEPPPATKPPTPQIAPRNNTSPIARVTSPPIPSIVPKSRKLLTKPIQNSEPSLEQLANNAKFCNIFGENKNFELGIIRKTITKRFVDPDNIKGAELLLSMLIDKLIESPPTKFDSDFLTHIVPKILTEIKSSEVCPDFIKNFSPPKSNRR